MIRAARLHRLRRHQCGFTASLAPSLHHTASRRASSKWAGQYYGKAASGRRNCLSELAAVKSFTTPKFYQYLLTHRKLIRLTGSLPPFCAGRKSACLLFGATKTACQGVPWPHRGIYNSLSQSLSHKPRVSASSKFLCRKQQKFSLQEKIPQFTNNGVGDHACRFQLPQ